MGLAGACSLPAQGTVRYVNMGGVQFPSIESGMVVNEELNTLDNHMDFNSDGVTDIIVRTRGGTTQTVVPEGENAVLARLNAPPDISSIIAPLPEGFGIGPETHSSLSWVPPRANPNPRLGPLGSNLSACFTIGCLGDFFGQTAYMGVEFEIDGQTHYGWVHLFSKIAHSDIYAYAYNTVPGEMIFAGQVPEPSTWVLLIGGGAFLWWKAKVRDASPRRTDSPT